MLEKIKDFLESLGYILTDDWADKGVGYRFTKREPDDSEITISVFMGNKGRQTISKVDASNLVYNNYKEFTPTELKFFDLLDFEISYWHNYHTEQNAQDWASAAEIELEY